MTWLSSAFTAALCLGIVVQALFTTLFLGVFRRRQVLRPSLPVPAPTAEVVLCLRGADPSLVAALQALAAQTYPGPWRLLLIVDSLQDVAWSIAEQLIRELEDAGNANWQTARMLTLNKAQELGLPPSGSLKCLALRQAFDALDPTTDVVALVDADAVVGPHWLQFLSAGCFQPGVGAVWGNRWYLPESGTMTGQVRGIWNLGALVVMTLFGIPWGGTLAVRREVITSSSWKEMLKTSFGEDTTLPSALRSSGWSHQFRPELLVVDRNDTISLKDLAYWIRRQLFSARLHHRSWPAVLSHAVSTMVLLTGTVCVLIIAALKQQWAIALNLLLMLLAYEVVCVVLILLIRGAIRTTLPDKGDSEHCLSWCDIPYLIVAQWVHGHAAVRAAVNHRITWSGIAYRWRGGRLLRLNND